MAWLLCEFLCNILSATRIWKQSKLFNGDYDPKANTFDNFMWKGRNINAGVWFSGYVKWICLELKVELKPLVKSKKKTQPCVPQANDNSLHHHDRTTIIYLEKKRMWISSSLKIAGVIIWNILRVWQPNTSRGVQVYHTRHLQE